MRPSNRAALAGAALVAGSLLAMRVFESSLERLADILETETGFAIFASCLVLAIVGAIIMQIALG